MDIAVLLSLLPVGFVVGLLGGLLGVGGGFVLVPILILVYRLQAHDAIGTSLAMVIFTALSASLAYRRQKRIDWRVGLVAALGTAPAAVLGAAVTPLIAATTLAVIFGGLLAAVGMRLILAPGRVGARSSTQGKGKAVWQRRLVDAEGKVFDYSVDWRLGSAALVGGGFAAGFLGVGGGVVVVPIFSLLLGLPVHLAIATSLLTMIPTAVTGTVSHLLLGNVVTEYAVPLILGSWAGSQLGARLARRTLGRQLERAFGGLLLVMAALLFLGT